MREFFAVLYGELPPGTALLVRQVADPERDLGANRKVLLTRLYKSLDELPSEWRSDAHIWFGVGLRPATGGSKPILWPALWCDFDSEDQPDLSAVPPPTAVVRSGRGLHLYWKLRTPIEDQALVHKYARGVCRAVGADTAAAEPARLLRVPGTWNVKYNPPVQAALLELHPDRVYDLRDFSEIPLEDEKPPQPIHDDIVPEPVSLEDVLPHLTPLQRKLLWHGEEEEVREHFRSWSEFEYSVILSLAEANFSKGQIYGFFLDNEDLVIWSRGKRGGNKESIKEYLRRTIHKAFGALEHKRRLQELADECGLLIQSGKMYAVDRKGDPRQITNFTINPVFAVEGDDEGINVELVRDDGFSRVVLLDGKSLSTKMMFRQKIGDQFVFEGGDSDLSRIHKYLLRQPVPRKRASRVLGWHKEGVLDSFRLWGPDGPVEESDLYYSGPYEWRLELIPDWDRKAAEAIRLLLRLHEPSMVWALLGWTLSTFVAPKIRAARGGGESWGGEYNGLWVWGIQGSGKTITTTQFLRLTSSPFLTLAGHSSVAGLHLVISSSNVCPVFIDDPRKAHRAADEAALREILIGAFTGSRIHKAKADLKGTIAQPLLAPCVGTGERAIEDGAVFERMFHVPCDREYLMNHLEETREVLTQLQRMPLEKLAGGFFSWWWDIDVDAAWDRAMRLTQHLADKGAADRARKAVAQIILGLEAALEIADVELEYSLGEIAEQLWIKAYESVGMNPRAIANTGIRDLLLIVWNLIAKGRLREGEDFRVVGDAMYLNVNRASYEISEASKFSPHPYTQTMVFRMFATKSEVTTSMERVRFPGGEENSPLCVVINLTAVREALGITDAPWLHRRGGIEL